MAATSWNRAGKLAVPGGPRDAYRSGLERFAQRLQQVAAEFRQLVEEQNAAMREARSRLDRSRPPPPMTAVADAP